MIEGKTIVAFDTEYTAWEGSIQREWSGPNEYREIVQFGAVKLDVANEFAEIDSFDTLVRPRINSTLSDYFIELTGITQEHVDTKGVDFSHAIEAFANFAGPDNFIYSNGFDGAILVWNCELYGLTFPMDESHFRDISGTFLELSRLSHVECNELDTVFGFELNLPAHNALSDARKIAAAFRHLRSQGRL